MIRLTGWQRHLPRALLGAGAVLVGLAAWEWGGARWAQRQAQAEAAALPAPPPAVAGAPEPPAPPPSVLAASPAPAPAAVTAAAGPAGGVAPPAPAPAPVFPAAGTRQGAPLFRLEIPKISVRNIVVYGSTAAALKRGPGLVEGTPLPGQTGNAAVSAHRDYYFWRLGELQIGDEIRVSGAAGELRYRVTGKKVVNEWEVDVLNQTRRPTLTLITCWPLIFAGDTPDRLVVVADQIPADAARPEGLASS